LHGAGPASDSTPGRHIRVHAAAWTRIWRHGLGLGVWTGMHFPAAHRHPPPPHPAGGAPHGGGPGVARGIPSALAARTAHGGIRAGRGGGCGRGIGRTGHQMRLRARRRFRFGGVCRGSEGGLSAGGDAKDPLAGRSAHTSSGNAQAPGKLGPARGTVPGPRVMGGGYSGHGLKSGVGGAGGTRVSS
jgi:hypothetical protein